jgi:ABC-2 type transport system ATP-binding protein
MMLTLSHVSKAYGSAKAKAVDDLSLDIAGGQIIGFFGPNGAGKTTTIKMVTGILAPDSGRICVNGYDIAKQPLEAKMCLGYVPDSPDMFLRLTGMEYLNFMGDMYRVPAGERETRIAQSAEAFEMTATLDTRMQSYSHGMRQKLIIMGVLLHQPEVWILDEPLTGLDPKASFELKEMMRGHARAGKTVFFSTHVLEVAEKLCDKVVIINKGRMIFFDELDKLKARHSDLSLEEIFLAVTSDV